MAKRLTAFVCQQCGASAPKWTGKCEACGAWNSLVEENISPSVAGKLAKSGHSKQHLEFTSLAADTTPVPRLPTGFAEVDRVLGDGLVAGSATLIGGDPGIGKSTLLLQLACRLSAKVACVYVSGEEAAHQIRLRAERLGLSNSQLVLATENNVGSIIAALKANPPAVLIIDSIQTMHLDQIESAPGTVAQVRASAHELINFAKKQEISLFLVGHVTKEGMIAGPKVLEHMVDTVLYLEGDRGHQFRILRAAKNRFGPTNEMGVFDMGPQGLQEVSNPSALFLSETRLSVPGNTVFVGLEGTRPILGEVQTLLAPSYYGTPRRATVGWDQNRLNLLLAVLESRLGVGFGQHDVYLNIAGGLKITEPATDLAVAAALLSARFEIALPPTLAAFGEIGLSGEVRPVPQADLRVREASKLGFSQLLLPAGSKLVEKTSNRLQLTRLAQLQDLPAMLKGNRLAA